MPRFTLILSALVALLLGYGFTHAQVVPPEKTFQLGLPLQCRLNEDCWVYNYVDMDPTSGVLDPGCGHRSYDEHSGTDFGLRDLSVMREGVPVLASAAGVVKGVRDGMPDISVDVAGKASVQGKECGNGVLIDHKNGWTTQYCHMKEDSVRPKIGDYVEAGQQLGQVGLSGNTEFPHVHLTVRHDDVVIDPFTGFSQKGQCRGKTMPLWKTPIAYQPMSLVNLGITGAQPNVVKIRQGDSRQSELSRKSPMMIFWVDMLGVEAGDVLKMTIMGPNGEIVVDQTTPLQSRKARWFQYVGKKQATSWPIGSYKATVVFSRQPTGISQTRSFLFAVN